MRAVWSLQRATVQTVRAALDDADRSAYTTIQTVLNRLADRGLLSREKVQNVVYYEPVLSEADYIQASLQRTLAEASVDARQLALTNLVSSMEGRDLDLIRKVAARVSRLRRA